MKVLDSSASPTCDSILSHNRFKTVVTTRPYVNTTMEEATSVTIIWIKLAKLEIKTPIPSKINEITIVPNQILPISGSNLLNFIPPGLVRLL